MSPLWWLAWPLLLTALGATVIAIRHRRADRRTPGPDLDALRRVVEGNRHGRARKEP